MYRFKGSKYKNALPKVPKKGEGWVLDIAVGAPQSFGNHIKASALFKAFNVENRGGGSLGVLQIDDTGKKNKNCPLLHAHTDFVTDFDFCPYDDGLLATCSIDSTVKIWRIPEEGIPPNSIQDPEMVLQEKLRVENVVFNPSVDCLLATAAERTVRLWDLTKGIAISSFTKHQEVIQSLSWKADGSLVASSGRDRMLRIWDPRSPNGCLEASGHANNRDSRVLWLGDTNYVLSSGLGGAREREVTLRDTRSIDVPCATASGESAMGIFVPLYDPDSNMLFLVAKGDNTVNFWELTFRDPFFLEASKYMGEVQTKGAGLVPKRALKVMDCEVNRVLLLGQESIVPLSYQVPRKTYRDFHSDIFPDTHPASPSITIGDWLEEKPAKEVPKISLDPEKRPKAGIVRINHKLGSGPVIDDVPKVDENRGKTWRRPFKVPSAPPTPAPRKKVASRQATPLRRERSQGAISMSSMMSQTPAASNFSIISTSSVSSAFPVAAPRVAGLVRRESSRNDGRVFRVRISKFRHLNGTPGPRNTHITNLPPLCKTIPGESEGFRANTERVALPLAISGGHVAVLELSKMGRLQSGVVPSLICGTSVMDFAWDPFNNSRIAIACDDARVRIWTIPEGGLTQSLTQPVAELKGHTEKVTFVKFHPTASDVLATASHDLSLIIWDLADQEAKLRLLGHTDQIFSLAWNPDGTTLATMCKDLTLRVFDPRNSEEPVVEGPGPSGTRGARVIWALGGTHLITSGFNKVSERQVSLYDASDLSAPLTTEGIDVSPAILIPFYDEDSSTLFLTGKGDCTIYTFEVALDPPCFFPLSHYKSNSPHQAVCFLHKAACNVSDVEFAKAYRLTGISIEPLSFKVPRLRSQLFQDDLFPDTKVTWEPTMSSQEWFAGETPSVRTICLRPAGMDLLSDAPKPSLASVSRTPDVSQLTTADSSS
ncbi:coronin-7-like [Ornithodoros turicata]|uniref:coronin-7-like n=1 Tax=Ornithodoros turicata TaxID=34597 RepID=UPI0031392E5C